MSEKRKIMKEQEYIDMLNDCHPEIEIKGIIYDVAVVLKAVDPVAYKDGLAAFAKIFGMEIESTT